MILLFLKDKQLVHPLSCLGLMVFIPVLNKDKIVDRVYTEHIHGCYSNTF